MNGSDVPRMKLSIDGNQELFVFGVFPQKTVSISGVSIGNVQVGVYNNQGTLSDSNCDYNKVIGTASMTKGLLHIVRITGYDASFAIVNKTGCSMPSGSKRLSRFPE